MNKTDSPGVVIPPPVYIAIVIATAYGLSEVVPVQIENFERLNWTGYLLIGLAIIILAGCAWQFYRHNTDIRPHKPASCVIFKGPYVWSRNPIYLSFLLIQLGFGLSINHVWTLLLLPLSYLILRYHVIAREERYLLRAFGEEYQAYCCKVGRWF